MKRRVTSLAAVGVLLGSLALTACGSSAHTSECILIVGNGLAQSHGVKDIVYPGGTYGDPGSDELEHLPCGARNFEITPPGTDHGDRHDPTPAKTAGGPSGAPGVIVEVWSELHFTLNQGKAALIDFWPLCQKYTCESHEDHSNDANFSTPGWNGMLQENMSEAINRAISDAITTFPPDVWKDPSQRPKVAAKAQEFILAEIRLSTKGNYDYFCAPGSQTASGGKCEPPTFVINDIQPKDKRLLDIQNNEAAAASQASDDDIRIGRTNKLYGPYADQYRGLQDTIEKCKEAGQSCTIVVGNPPIVPLGK